MKKLTRIVFSLLIFMMTILVLPMATPAEAASDFNLTKNESYNMDGKYFLSFTVKSYSSSPKLAVTAQLLNPSGSVIYSYNGFTLAPGKSQKWGFGYNYSSLPSGTYTLKLNIRNHDNPMDPFASQWTGSYNIKHTAPAPSFSFKSYETYYNDVGKLMHKINIQCKNMKGERLYCKIYDSEGYLVTDFGTDTFVRKTNNETGFFAWDGYKNGQKYPSGEYTFVITSSANKKVLQKTLRLNILEVSKG
ncbi:MAG: hypothetical protein ACOX2Q_11030 [Dehalobacterium sp.]|jgi:hypothetical protein